MREYGGFVMRPQKARAYGRRKLMASRSVRVRRRCGKGSPRVKGDCEERDLRQGGLVADVEPD